MALAGSPKAQSRVHRLGQVRIFKFAMLPMVALVGLLNQREVPPTLRQGLPLRKRVAQVERAELHPGTRVDGRRGRRGGAYHAPSGLANRKWGELP